MASGTLRTLNEQEIQERLYGRYHKTPVPVPKIPSRPAPVFQRTTKPLKIALPDFSWVRPLFSQVQSYAASVFKTFPWRFFIVAAGAVALLTVLFQNLPFWIHQITVSKPARVSAPSVVSPAALKTDSDVLVPLAAPAQSSPASVEKKKSYVVQVCTYQRKADADRLVGELTSLNFPAHYIKIPVRGAVTHYLVVLGRDATYAQARERLAEFRKSPLYQKFSDSFIRSF